MAATSIHANSVSAYHEERPQLSARARQILQHVRRVGPRTDRQLMGDLGFSDMNSVRPRITELCQLGLLCECGECKCPVTGKTVRIVDAVRKQGVLF